VSAFTKAPFGEVAPYLADYGYPPVPIKPGFKAPMLDGWQGGHPPEHYLPHRDPSSGKVTDCRRWGTGILTATCPAVDLDIKDRELVRVLLELVDEVLGYAPFRIGAPPKALVPFSTAAPFDKISGRWWALPGENFRAPSYSPHRIEVLGQGQQFVAYAIHPGTGRAYRWRKGCPMTVLHVDLPEIDEALARTFLAAAEQVLEDVGAVPLRKVAGEFRPDLGQPEKSEPLRRYGSGETVRDWQLLDPETLAKRIDAKNARRLKNGGWITACPAHRSEGARSLSITPRDGGGSVVHCFAECSFADISNAISSILGRR
jgi:Bifunctional DNA primase/polymerase, N-terminal